MSIKIDELNTNSRTLVEAFDPVISGISNVILYLEKHALR